MSALINKSTAVLFALLLGFGALAGCSDEDGDGATTDEEIDQIDEGTEDVRDEIEDEVDDGEDEVDDGNNG